MSKMVRVSNQTDDYINEIASEAKVSKQKIVEKAVAMFAKRFFLLKTNKEYADLDVSELEKDLQEVDEWDDTLLDGLDK